VKPERLTTDELLATLTEIRRCVEAGDSFGGHLEYEAVDGDAFDVTASYRIGNRMGQGGMRVIGTFEEPTT
jgi:hypothetical protein